MLDTIWRSADLLPGVGMSIPQATANLRRQLTEQMANETGLTVRRIDVTVEELDDA